MKSRGQVAQNEIEYEKSLQPRSYNFFYYAQALTERACNRQRDKRVLKEKGRVGALPNDG